MSVCTACGDTRISPACQVVGEGVARYAWWPPCPACADWPLVDHMARVYGQRRRYGAAAADRWLTLFRPDEQAQILRLVGVGRQLDLGLIGLDAPRIMEGKSAQL